MAVFNPGVTPTQDPNYLNYSKVIDAPPPNLSKSIGINTATQGLDTAVTATDMVIKKSISDSAYKNVDPIRDEMISSLERVKSDLNQGIIPKPGQTVAGNTVGKSWLDANAMSDPDELPAGLADSIAGVQALAAAKAAGSPKLNDTKYAGDVLSKARQDRAFYGPGYREYIDQKYSEASGLPIANSYYQNMLIDINRQLTQMGKTKDDIGNALMKAQDMPGQADLIMKRRTGQEGADDYTVLKRINEWEANKEKVKLDAAARLSKTGDKQDLIDTQTASLDRVLGDHVRINMSALKDASLPGGGTGKDLIDFMSDYSKGNHPEISETEFNQKRQQYNNYIIGVKKSALAIAEQYSPTIGAKAANDLVNAKMEPLFVQQQFVNNKEDGPAFYVSHAIEHIKADETHNILIDKDAGSVARRLLGTRGALGEQYFPDFIRSMSGSGVIDKLAPLVQQEAIAAIQPLVDTRGQPVPRYHKDAIVHGKEVGAGDLDPKFFGENGVTKVVTEIANPNMNLAAKDKLIDYSFNPKNVGRLEELKMDYRDPVTDKWVGGKYRMFNILSSDSIIQGVKSTALVHPENYRMFQRTLETEFGRLYRSTIQDINKLVSNDKAYLGLHFSYDDKAKQFGLVDSKNRPIQEDYRVAHADRIPANQNPNGKYISAMLDKLELINGGVKNLANVHQNNPQGGKDTDTYLLQMMQTAGFRTNGDVTGATENMMKALIKSKNPDMSPQDLDKLIFGSPGGVTPSKK